MESDRTKYLIAVEPQISPPAMSHDTAYSIGVPIAIAAFTTLATLWAYSKFINKDQYERDQAEIAKRFDSLNKETDQRVDKISLELAQTRGDLNVAIVKIETYVLTASTYQDVLIQEFNRLRAENHAYQESINKMLVELTKEIKVTNHGLETMHTRLDRKEVKNEQ